MTKWVVHILFSLGILAPVTLLLAYFVSASFTAMWLISFVLWHILASMVAVIVLKKLLFK